MSPESFETPPSQERQEAIDKALVLIEKGYMPQSPEMVALLDVIEGPGGGTEFINSKELNEAVKKNIDFHLKELKYKDGLLGVHQITRMIIEYQLPKEDVLEIAKQVFQTCHENGYPDNQTNTLLEKMYLSSDEIKEIHKNYATMRLLSGDISQFLDLIDKNKLEEVFSGPENTEVIKQGLIKAIENAEDRDVDRFIEKFSISDDVVLGDDFKSAAKKGLATIERRRGMIKPEALNEKTEFLKKRFSI